MPVFPFLQATQIRFIEHRSRREDGKTNTKEQLQAKGAVACTLSLVRTTVFKRSKAAVYLYLFSTVHSVQIQLFCAITTHNLEGAAKLSPYIPWSHIDRLRWAPLVPNRGTEWRWVVSFILRPLYQRGKAANNHRIKGFVCPRAGLDVV